MNKRQLILGNYKTAETGQWTLSACKITKAAQVQTFLSVPGRHAPLDLSTSLTGGVPYYENARLEAVLESSEGTRAERQERIEQMVNLLDGYNVQIIHPDHPAGYMVGRVQITQEYNDWAHCSVRVSAVCEPWRYNATETVKQATVPSSIAGKNILPYPYAATTFSKTGINWTDNGDGSITAKGTPVTENAAGFQLCADASILQDGVTYTLSCEHPYAPSDVSLFCYYLDENGKSQYKKSFTWSNKYTFKTINLQLNSTAVNYDFTFYPQMELGASATDYEPYFKPGDHLLDLTNNGRLAMVPKLVVTGEVTLKCGNFTRALSSGTYYLPDLYLTPGTHQVICSGEGTATFTYREAVLAE